MKCSTKNYVQLQCFQDQSIDYIYVEGITRGLIYLRSQN
jgi:hypothetical protein